MEQGMVGRIKERQILRRCIGSGQAEWVAVDGRRGTGKTYLVQQLLGKEICFYLVGVPQCPMPVLLACFQEQLFIYSGVWRSRPKHWEEAFAQLRQYLESLSRGCKRILFIDELSGLDGPKSGFLMALDRFWQEWASQQAHLTLIVCGSATHKQSLLAERPLHTVLSVLGRGRSRTRCQELESAHGCPIVQGVARLCLLAAMSASCGADRGEVGHLGRGDDRLLLEPQGRPRAGAGRSTV